MSGYMEILFMSKLVAKVAGVHEGGKVQFSSNACHGAARQVPSNCSEIVVRLRDRCAAA